MTMMTPEPTKADLQWQVRFTWEPLNGVPHPKYTYSSVQSESRAIDSATTAIDRMDGNAQLRLVEVHWRHISSNDWRKVE